MPCTKGALTPLVLHLSFCCLVEVDHKHHIEDREPFRSSIWGDQHHGKGGSSSCLMDVLLHGGSAAVWHTILVILVQRHHRHVEELQV